MARSDELRCLNLVRDAFFERINSPKIVFDNSEKERLSVYLSSAAPNPNENDYPDFLCDGAILEHFVVTSSKQNRKGSRFHVEKQTKDRKIASCLESEKKAFLSSDFEKGKVAVHSHCEIYNGFAYDYFFHSFRNNIEKHLNSSRKRGLSGPQGNLSFGAARRKTSHRTKRDVWWVLFIKQRQKSPYVSKETCRRY